MWIDSRQGRSVTTSVASTTQIEKPQLWTVRRGLHDDEDMARRLDRRAPCVVGTVVTVVLGEDTFGGGEHVEGLVEGDGADPSGDEHVAGLVATQERGRAVGEVAELISMSPSYSFPS